MIPMSVTAFNNTVQKSNLWLSELMGILKLDNEQQAYSCLRVVLHTLRDRLDLGERAHLGAELPMLIRGLYYEGWDPDREPSKLRHKEDFIKSVEARMPPGMMIPPEKLARGVFQLLGNHISRGEIHDILSSLPEEIRQLWAREEGSAFAERA